MILLRLASFQSLEMTHHHRNFFIVFFVLFLILRSKKYAETYFMQEHESYTVARDSFLAHLGSVLWGSMRHIIAPSVSDGAYHYYEKISFQLYFITQEVKL